jgi:hypothetical protein
MENLRNYWLQRFRSYEATGGVHGDLAAFVYHVDPNEAI